MSKGANYLLKCCNIKTAKQNIWLLCNYLFFFFFYQRHWRNHQSPCVDWEKKKKKVNIVKIVGLTVQEIEGYKSFSIKQFTSIMINFLCCPLLGRSIFFIGILVYYNTKLVTLFFSWTYNIYRVIDLLLLTNVL